MNIVLTKPGCNALITAPPLGLGYLSACLKQSGYNPYILDPLQKNGMTPSELISRILGLKPKMICLSLTTDHVMSAKYLFSILKTKAPHTILVAGGPHATAIPEETLLQINADIIVYGEGEETIVELATKIHNDEKGYGNIKGICYKNNKGDLIKTPPRPLIKNLDKIPFPDWDQIQPTFYPETKYGGYSRSYPVGNIITSRGCPHRCAFCSSAYIWEQKYRQRSTQNIVDEIELLVRKYVCKTINFVDDNITQSKQKMMEICDEIIRRELNISWKCPSGVRIDTLDDELLTKMRSSGCYFLSLGIESACQHVLNLMKKRLDINMVREKIGIIKKHGIRTHGFFVLGFPGESYSDIMETIRFAKSCGLDEAQFSIVRPNPGSELFNKWRIGRDLTNVDWDKFMTRFDFYENNEIKQIQLRSLQKKALIDFYISHPLSLIYTLVKLHRSEYKNLIIFIKRFFASPYSYNKPKKKNEWSDIYANH